MMALISYSFFVVSRLVSESSANVNNSYVLGSLELLKQKRMRSEMLEALTPHPRDRCGEGSVITTWRIPASL
jgi:hypothetical protein